MMDDLSCIARLTDAELCAMRDADFKDLMKGINTTAEVADDHAPDPDHREADPFPIPPPAPAPAPSPVGHPAAIVPVIVPPVAIVHDVAGLHGLKVSFDNFSHQSGHQRAFLYCPLHAACRRYVFLRDFASRERAAAWLFTWAVHGRRFDDHHGHVGHNPDEDSVRAVCASVFGGGF